ncbi:MAG TPA: PfkB family carbohydrate kinase [Methanomassiliicoccaceae archaeon]|jgi:sugar/nucleoside kinase (ribokinase family)|nr:PfkB family carbohydrate kinase [Methanomassiliicoccaceae archaeon]HOL06955.1 PfkB family carbohydrate kinase [Methanomassiliicoccaceae archaeon]HPT74154.1 PfkB family carbohydrate kinase [Methanomassiliicoccaceae archaeon]HQA20490.1 PfkB family carbohydrate kinase [Methanomassiliicoccaceae archaeon]HQD87246.1 PfkB family carbohydrate kinase [Methanomassiliicoccaceae archaeon]
MDVVGVGALNVDLLYEVSSLRFGSMEMTPGSKTYGTEETFRTLIKEVERHGQLAGRSGGGSAANTIYALSRLGYRTAFLGVAGKDEEGDFILSSMEGVDLSRVKRHGRSGKCLSLLMGGDRSLFVIPNSNDLFSYTEEDIEFLNSSKFVHLGSFAADSALASQNALMDYLDDDVYVSFSPGELYARRGVQQLAPILERTRIMFLNGKEMRLLTGKGPEEGARMLLDQGPRVVVCTLGEDGSVIITRNSEITVPAKRTVIRDATGAGDVYAAGFLAGYIDGATLEVCGEIGSAAAALSVTSYGREGYPDERFLRRFADAM